MIRWSYPRIARERIGNRRERIPGGVGRHHAVDTRHILAIEEILRLDEHFAARLTPNGNESRVAKVEVDDVAETSGIALDVERAIVASCRQRSGPGSSGC